mgnify:CR=1 FL=1
MIIGKGKRQIRFEDQIVPRENGTNLILTQEDSYSLRREVSSFFQLKVYQLEFALKFHYHCPLKISSPTHKVTDQEAIEPCVELAAYPIVEPAWVS